MISTPEEEKTLLQVMDTLKSYGVPEEAIWPLISVISDLFAGMLKRQLREQWIQEITRKDA